MSLRKKFLKSRPVCKVTFNLPKEAVREGKTVNLVGEFNNWDLYATPMKRLKDGSFTATVDLEEGSEYQFRYLIDEMFWENDWDADKYMTSQYGNCENSVVVV